MYCPRCRARMKEIRGTHHKKKKWQCSECGKVRFSNLSVKETARTTHKIRDRNIDKY